jgi:hypothetical protein
MLVVKEMEVGLEWWQELGLVVERACLMGMKGMVEVREQQLDLDWGLGWAAVKAKWREVMVTEKVVGDL